MIISISGRINHGKDTVADIIRYLTSESYKKGCSFEQFKERSNNFEAYGGHYFSHWDIKKFAKKLKHIASILTGIPEHKFEDREFKNSYLGDEWDYLYSHPFGGNEPMEPELFRMSVRMFLQRLGTDAIREGLHDNTWVNALFADYYDDYYWIICDTRFLNEIEAVKKHGGITVRVVRDIPKPKNEHVSETALDNYHFDYVIQNDGTIEDLIIKVEKFMNYYNLL